MLLSTSLVFQNSAFGFFATHLSANPSTDSSCHNFISHHDPDKDEMEDLDDFDDGGDFAPGKQMHLVIEQQRKFQPFSESIQRFIEL